MSAYLGGFIWLYSLHFLLVYVSKGCCGIYIYDIGYLIAGFLWPPSVSILLPWLPLLPQYHFNNLFYFIFQINKKNVSPTLPPVFGIRFQILIQYYYCGSILVLTAFHTTVTIYRPVVRYFHGPWYV